MKFNSLKKVLVGSPLATAQARHERLSKTAALAVFSSDALSSVAYATEEILLILVLAGTAALHYSIPIGFAIAALIAVVVSSYRQTIFAYPQGGGSYIVTKDNLGTLPGLISGAALLIDYVLTVAVSVAAGVAALTSAVPALYDYRVVVGVGFVAAITVGQPARVAGIRQRSSLCRPIYSFPSWPFSLPTASCAGPSGGSPRRTSRIRYRRRPGSHVSSSCCGPSPPDARRSPGWRRCRTACPPSSRPKRRTRASCSPGSGSSSSLSSWASPFSPGTITSPRCPEQTILSQLARQIFGDGVLYYSIQASTMLILVLAANTAFADFPRLSFFLARDGFLPRQFGSRGDRLVFSNGILILGAPPPCSSSSSAAAPTP